MLLHAIIVMIIKYEMKYVIQNDIYGVRDKAIMLQ